MEGEHHLEKEETLVYVSKLTTMRIDCGKFLTQNTH